MRLSIWGPGPGYMIKGARPYTTPETLVPKVVPEETMETLFLSVTSWRFILCIHRLKAQH